MAVAYVKNDALNFYSSPSKEAVITKIERSGQTEPYLLNGFSEGAELGVLTGKEENGFVEVEHPFDIRRKISSTKKWLWAFPPAGLAATQLSQWSHETELVWVLKADITTENPEEAAAAAKKAKTQKLIDSINETGDANLTAAGSETTSVSTGLIVAIVAGVGVLIGILWWAFGRKKNAEAAVVAPPTVIQLKPAKNGNIRSR